MSTSVRHSRRVNSSHTFSQKKPYTPSSRTTCTYASKVYQKVAEPIYRPPLSDFFDGELVFKECNINIAIERVMNKWQEQFERTTVCFEWKDQLYKLFKTGQYHLGHTYTYERIILFQNSKQDQDLDWIELYSFYIKCYPYAMFDGDIYINF